MRGERLSVRLPRRTVPIWVRLPIGRESPWRIASTPAMKVVATAPMPGSRMPSFPSAGGIDRALLELFMTELPGGSRGRRPKAAMLSQPAPPRRLARRGTSTTAEGSGGSPPLESRARDSLPSERKSSVAGEEVEGGRGQLLVVARSDEPPLLHVVVEDSRPGKVLLGLERVEHEDPRVAREAAVVEESKGEVAHRQAVPAPGSWSMRNAE